MAEEPTSADSDATVVMPEPRRDLRVGDVLKGRFELVEILGRGGMGQVFKAVDRIRVEANDPDHFVAVKVLGDAFKVHPNAGVAFEREAKKAMLLTHENICRVRDFDRDGDTRFMTMEYLSGRSLDSIVNADGFAGLPLDKAIDYLAPICIALDYAHNRRPPIVHYDLKPGNIFCTDRGTVKLIDFGIARAVKGGDAEQTMITEAVVPALSPRYASPEMLEGMDPDPRDDIYALGCVAYMLLTGRHPFGMSATVARDQGLEPHRPEGLDNRAWAAIERALAFDRSKRTASAGAFLAELRDTGRRPGRSGLIAAGLVGLAVVAAGGYLAGEHFGWFNTAPRAEADAASVFQGRPVDILVLANDTDADNDPLTVTGIVTPPQYGTARIGSDGRIHYRAGASFIGEDWFIYTVEDGRGGSASAMVKVMVSPPPAGGVVRLPPQAVDDEIATAVNTARDLRPLANDSHPGGQSFTLERIIAEPRHGRATILDPETVRYTPEANYIGADAFTYGVIDPAGERASARVIVTVQDAPPPPLPPQPRDDEAVTEVGRDVTVDVLANDFDPAGGSLEVVRVSRPRNGTVQINADNTLTFRPTAGFTGTVVFTYSVRSSAGTEAEATVAVVVGTANQLPVASDVSATARSGQPVELDPISTASDPDGDPLAIVAIGQPASGSAVIDGAGQRVIYTANAGFVGADSFGVTIGDGRGGTVTARARITVVPAGPDRDAIARVLAQVPCALFEPPRLDGGVVTIAGRVGAGFRDTDWQPRLAAISGIDRVEWRPHWVDDTQCLPLDLLRPLADVNRDGAFGLAVVTSREVFRAGESLSLRMTAPTYNAYVYIDYFTLEGQVVHMLPRPSASGNRVPARSLKTLGDGGGTGEWVVGPPFGHELISVIASPVPLFPAPRTEIESTETYVAALRAAIDRVAARADPRQPVLAALTFNVTSDGP